MPALACVQYCVSQWEEFAWPVLALSVTIGPFLEFTALDKLTLLGAHLSSAVCYFCQQPDLSCSPRDSFLTVIH